MKAKQKHGKVETRPMPKLEWRGDMDKYRVWRTDWFSDQFEVLSLEDWAKVKWVCERFSIPFEENMDE